MRHWLTLPSLLALLTLLTGCTTPYRPAVVVRASAPFPGIATVVGQSPARAADVLLVHGMCPHDQRWANDTIAMLAQALAGETGGATAPAATAARAVQVIERSLPVAGGTAHFHALVWSPLVAGLKAQLDYDMTGTPADCAADPVCRPRRAYLNGRLKDELLNACLADAVIYAGQSHAAIRQAMVDTVTRLLDETEERSGGAPGPLVVVAESLGSKLLFDALSAMMRADAPPRAQALAQRAAQRMAILYMVGNQLPILGLADQQIDPAATAGDALQRFLLLRRAAASVPRGPRIGPLSIIAFTDPNDLLSYRLLPSRYAAPDVAVADVLVSNAPTWFGLLEDPFAAHLDYLDNPDVRALIACGWPRPATCR